MLNLENGRSVFQDAGSVRDRPLSKHLQSCVAAIRRADYHFTGAFHGDLTPTGSEVSMDRGGSGAGGGSGRAGGEFVSESMRASGRFVLSLS